MEMKPIKTDSENGSPGLLDVRPSEKMSPELEYIIREEQRHFPLKRTLSYFTTLVFLFVTSIMLGSVYEPERLVPIHVGIVVLVLFLIYCVVMTYFSAKDLKKIHNIKT